MTKLTKLGSQDFENFVLEIKQNMIIIFDLIIVFTLIIVIL